MPKIQYKEINFRGKSLELINLVNQVVEEYQAQGYELTLRQAYYQLVARGYIPNNERSYKNIGSLINDGRLAGLIDWYSITDRTRNLRSNGHWNTGNRNTGDCNTGDWNTGDCNTGDWNKSSFNTGCFNTEEQKIMLFNKPSDMTYSEWLDSDARYLLNQIPKDVVEWVYEEDMTDAEKAAHPTYETTGGYLKVLDESECGQLWWGSLSDRRKEIIKAIPNFDAEIFFQCTGVRVDE